MELDEELKQNIIDLIRQGRRIPIAYKNLLFPLGEKAQEIELIYGIKERKEDILADTMSVPFQAVKKFGNVKEGDWHNKLIFADNIQALKFMLKDPEIKGKVKLIYIDPPFGTGELYDANGAPAYSAALQGAEFVEFLRKRLILLKELLADDGSIYVRIDYHFGHYVKVIMDEIFGKNNFMNEIVINRFRKRTFESNIFDVGTDSIFFYCKSTCKLNKITKQRICSFCGNEIEPQWRGMSSPGLRKPPERIIFGKMMLPPKGRHWTYSQERIYALEKEGKIRINKDISYTDIAGNKVKGLPEYLQTESIVVDSNWTDLKGYVFGSKYPTENPEELLERVILASSERQDLVLDCFAGSGTTGAVAEKLGRRWIMIDSSKLAIYTMIKRMFNLRSKISNKGKQLKPKPFVLYNAGLYEDHGFILNIGEKEYKQFAMELFQVEPKKFEINGLQMDGVLFNCPVKVFSQKGYLTEEFVDELHCTVGQQLKGRMFIIAPASRVYFLQDYIEKNGIRYYVLRIPYSVIDELHKRAFKRPMQPTSSAEINQLIEQVGFDFIHPPSVKAEYYRKKPKDRLEEKELVIEIKEFKAVQRSKVPVEFKDPKDALSMILVDTNHNGEYFNMTDYFFRKELEKEGWKARIPDQSTGKRIMIIYLDIFGNERIEVRTSDDFKKRS
jgi:site-specific DNA-methyltransferase (adenine-specific)/adenine-specific DNA-methyltransferase